ncbi:hypothetical protein DPMN_162599 [Dreissena polymorpha]|uniref:Uncharacterized protein n=1 Tax=Dreissena polymorpha TaxID=45954 RepID=A0A9D4ERT4_DREPO|nr:hypothetical protein DPMN_162599 [Dreissena polymorpha]
MMAADRHTRMYRAPLQGGHIPHPYDAALMTSHPYAAMYPGFDINGIRRKNATRESTSALKAWLFEHRKNPYPTKAESHAGDRLPDDIDPG